MSNPAKYARYFQFRLRTFLLLAFVASIISGTFALRVRRGRIQREAVQELIKHGVVVYHEGQDIQPGQTASANNLSAPDWVHDYWYQVTAIEFEGGGNAVADEELKRIRDLMYLKRVNLSSVKVTDETARRLLIARRLEQLDLWSSEVSNAGARGIGRLSQLKSLSLGNCPVGDTGAMEFSQLVNLQTLYLTGTDITDKSIEAICVLPKLEELTVANTDITDASIEFLVKMRALRHLNIVLTQISKPGAARLGQLMPDCTITYSAR